MKLDYRSITLAALLTASLGAHADTLILLSGKQISGTFLGATARQIEFLPTSGKAVKVALNTVEAVTFSEPQAAMPPPSQPTTPALRKPILLYAGTTFRVRPIDPIDVDYTQAGAKFRGSLDDPIMSGGDVVVPRGAPLVLVASKVQQGGKMKGSDLIELKASSISVSGRWQHVVT